MVIQIEHFIEQHTIINGVPSHAVFQQWLLGSIISGYSKGSE